jgi:hypothetical protein
LGVIAARVAVIGISICALQVCAQQVPQGHLKIRVTDEAGAVIPGARIEIDVARADSDSSLRTDNHGEFTCDLPAGPHTFSVVSYGFERWTTQINIQGDTGQWLAVTLRLRVAFYGSGSEFPEPRDDASLFVKIPEELILLPTVSLATLPLVPKPIRKHERRAKL